jgi:hypothetical protein
MPRSGANLLLFNTTVFHPLSIVSFGGYQNQFSRTHFRLGSLTIFEGLKEVPEQA